MYVSTLPLQGEQWRCAWDPVWLGLIHLKSSHFPDIYSTFSIRLTNSRETSNPSLWLWVHGLRPEACRGCGSTADAGGDGGPGPARGPKCRR